MPDSATSNYHMTCIWDEPTRTVCADEPFYREHKGKRYCVLHFPDKDKIGELEEALQRKIKNDDFDFRGVWFPDDLCVTETPHDFDTGQWTPNDGLKGRALLFGN